MSREALVNMVAEAAHDALPGLIGDFETAKALALARLTAPSAPATAGLASAIPEADRLWTPAEAAQRLRCPPGKVYDLLRARNLHGFKNGKYWAIPESSLVKYVRGRLKASE